MADWIASLKGTERDRALREIAPEQADRAALEYSWKFWGRPKQFAPPGDWRTWLVLAGRGFGKTRCGVEWIREKAQTAKFPRLALIGATADDVRDIIVEGESGILATSPPWFRPIYQPSKRKLTWPNGVMALLFTADEPERLRGKQHYAALCDEVAAWRYPESWDQLMLGLRLGDNPQCVVTTTPKPTAAIKELIASPTTIVTHGSTYENRGNLAKAFLKSIITKYEGTRLGRQELYAELLEDTPGALWSISQLDALRTGKPPTMRRVVVAIDPAVTSSATSDDTGIVVAGLGDDGHGYVLEDASGKHSPDAWARVAVNLYATHKADRIVAEVNNGGDMVELTIRTVDPNASYLGVHAARGKRTRAEPIAALYEQGKVHHVGMFAKLEDQMCTWDSSNGSRSPDRVDALVWALTELMLDGGPPIPPPQPPNMARWGNTSRGF